MSFELMTNPRNKNETLVIGYVAILCDLHNERTPSPFL